MRDAVFTVIANNYLPFARVLMQSLREFAPDVRRFVILVDRLDGSWDPAEEDFEVILSTDLGLPDSTWFHFKYMILELSTAVKPYAAQHLFERFALDRLLYFDPDIRLYRRVDDVLEALLRHSIVLTPHLTAPIRDGKRPGELDVLRSGAYNLGFIGMRATQETWDFLAWWQEKLFTHCVVDFAKGLFVDQRWVDLVPGLFDGVGILRDPGLNVAYWNLNARTVVKGEDGYTVNGRSLCFFHFSGFDPENPERLSKHQDRFVLEAVGDAAELARDYGRLLLKNGYADCRQTRYAYGWFANGKRIPMVGRAVHQVDPTLPARLSDPFSAEGYAEFVAIWNTPMEMPDGRRSSLTRLAYRIYQARPDLQAAMPDIFGADYARFLHWLLTSGIQEHSLPEELTAPLSAALRESEGKGHTVVPAILNNRITQAVLKARELTATHEPIEAAGLNQMTGTEKPARLTYLAAAI
ncbi:MAG TPA: hypothetical protein VFQ91_23135, partial [Bryobacteraceae bacterium]|nr:hypothetical protein [Bryobacteraceae bacterium]